MRKCVGHSRLYGVNIRPMARSDAAVRRAIDGLKLDDVLSRVIAERQWTEQQAQEALVWYRNFLWLTHKHGDNPFLAINQDSDYLWHAHITFTKRYSRDCKSIFGRFLDHTPTAGELRKRDRELFDASLRLYEAEFGTPPPNPVAECYVARP